MTTIEIPDELAASFSGELLAPDSPGYDDARRVHNGLVDKRPGLLARCSNTADVRDAVNLGRDAHARTFGRHARRGNGSSLRPDEYRSLHFRGGT